MYIVITKEHCENLVINHNPEQCQCEDTHSELG